jgi:triacylglycerol lipase
VRGELRYWLELARLLKDQRFYSVTPARDPAPVLLIPGFMASDASMAALAGWLRRRGHAVRGSGMLFNVGCAGRELARLEKMLAEFDRPAIVIGQSRGGTLARGMAAGHPDQVAGLVTLGSPVLDPLAVSAPVMRTVRSVAWLGDLGLPGVFSTSCMDGDCCTDFNSLLLEPLETGMPALAVHSRSDGIVDWRACLDPYAECVEVDGSHCGMAVNPGVYEKLEGMLLQTEEIACRQ